MGHDPSRFEPGGARSSTRYVVTIVAVATLAIGSGAMTVVFSVVANEFFSKILEIPARVFEIARLGRVR